MMKIRVLLVFLLMMRAAGAFTEPMVGIQQYLKALDVLTPYYSQFRDEIALQGFFQETTYLQLRAALSKDARFQTDVLRFYRSADVYFRLFHDYTLAYSCNTFKDAMGDKFPDDYYRELEDMGKKLTDASRRTDISSGQKAAIKEKIGAVELLKRRIREYQAALPLVNPAALRDVADHASEMNALYRRLLVRP